ncbi:hypothetical protein llap_5922 [Limosa lapponica baueri]|uniref:Uncharacterized protein n=1 Tax=Limosa lapponica baueri TaxID=1758121 RepID=A0A2I0UCI6_LIMLA|nr:hypothetical protein llap_5922 [Limosa lapponica baueri]
MPAGSMQLLSLAHRENDKGPLFPVPALRLQLPTSPTSLGRTLLFFKAKEATGLLYSEGRKDPRRSLLRYPWQCCSLQLKTTLLESAEEPDTEYSRGV